jgi:hypothetical protein
MAAAEQRRQAQAKLLAGSEVHNAHTQTTINSQSILLLVLCCSSFIITI